MSRVESRAKEFANVNQGFDTTTSKFVLAGVKVDNPFIVIRPTTPRSDRIEAKLFGAAHGFRGPPPKKTTVPIARWDGCRENTYGASFYSNANRLKEKAAATGTAEDPGAQAVARMFKYLQASNQDIVGNFEKMDADGSGELDVEEFKAALLAMGLGMSDEEMGLVMREIDTDGGGTVSIDEFVDRMKQIDSRMAEGGTGTVHEVLDRIFDFINTTKFRIIDMFNKIDIDGNGELDAVEFYACMKELGLDLSEGEVQLIMEVLDSDGGGSIGIDEFMTEMQKIHRKRRKAEKAARQDRSLSRMSDYEKKREASRYAGTSAHPATAGIDINFAFPDPEPLPPPPGGRDRRWRPPTAERFQPSNQAFSTHYSGNHNPMVFIGPQDGVARQRSLPAIDTSLDHIRGRENTPSGAYGRISLNQSALHATRTHRLRHKPLSSDGNPSERARWNSAEATIESEKSRFRSLSGMA